MQGLCDECSKIITVITVMLLTEKAGALIIKNTEKQLESPIDVWLTTLWILIEHSAFTLPSP